MESSRYAELFLSESRTHVTAINHHLLELERGGSADAVEELFRAAHTLKGMSAAMSCEGAAGLAHSMEHLLDRLRSGVLELDDPIMEALFDGADALERTIAAEVAGDPRPAELAPLLARLELLAGSGAAGGLTSDLSAAARVPGAEVDGGSGGAQAGGYRVVAMIQTSAALPAVRAMLVLRAARELGTVSAVDPGEEDLAAARFSGRLTFHLQTDRDAETVRATVLRAGEVSHVEVEEPGAAKPAVAAATRSAAREAAGAVDSFVRISQQRLDLLVDRVGELVIARDRLTGRVEEQRGGDEVLVDAAEQISRLISELRDEIMRMRMVPIGDAFDRFPRFVRDAARALRKEVQFEITGRDTPLDRSLHHELADVLIHLLRNALDHGIEPADEREARGKAPAGSVRLSAEAERSHVVVRVEDDGRGIDMEGVARAAVVAGLMSEESARVASPDELLGLLTRAGFSTRREVTDVSGRGVGLDVVASRIRAIRGVLEIESWPGEGTRFTLRLPLSLAILRTLQVEVGGTIYAIPISSIEEVVELGHPGAAAWSADGTEVEFRDEMVPVTSLAGLLGAARTTRPFAATPVVMAHGADGLFGFAVEALHGHHEAVLKSFPPVRGMIDAFAGATLLRDGRPALVLDPVKLGALAARSARPSGVPAAAAQS